MNKICSRCKKEKPIEHFGRKYKWYQPYCRECKKIYGREHYIKNRQKYIHKAKMWKRKIYSIISFIKNRPCQDCGRTYPPYVMDFDHRDIEIKNFTISPCVGSLAIKKLRNEIEKCDVVCSNCHRIRTWNRKYNRHKLTE